MFALSYICRGNRFPLLAAALGVVLLGAIPCAGEFTRIGARENLFFRSVYPSEDGRYVLALPRTDCETALVCDTFTGDEVSRFGCRGACHALIRGNLAFVALSASKTIVVHDITTGAKQAEIATPGGRPVYLSAPGAQQYAGTILVSCYADASRSDPTRYYELRWPSVQLTEIKFRAPPGAEEATVCRDGSLVMIGGRNGSGPFAQGPNRPYWILPYEQFRGGTAQTPLPPPMEFPSEFQCLYPVGANRWFGSDLQGKLLGGLYSPYAYSVVARDLVADDRFYVIGAGGKETITVVCTGDGKPVEGASTPFALKGESWDGTCGDGFGRSGNRFMPFLATKNNLGYLWCVCRAHLLFGVVPPPGAAAGTPVTAFQPLPVDDAVTGMMRGAGTGSVALLHEAADAVTIWGVAEGKVLRRVKTPSPRFVAVAGDKAYVANYRTGTVQVFDTRTWALLDELEAGVEHPYYLTARWDKPPITEMLVWGHTASGGSIVDVHVGKDVHQVLQRIATGAYVGNFAASGDLFVQSPGLEWFRTSLQALRDDKTGRFGAAASGLDRIGLADPATCRSLVWTASQVYSSSSMQPVFPGGSQLVFPDPARGVFYVLRPPVVACYAVVHPRDAYARSPVDGGSQLLAQAPEDPGMWQEGGTQFGFCVPLAVTVDGRTHLFARAVNGKVYECILPAQGASEPTAQTPRELGSRVSRIETGSPVTAFAVSPDGEQVWTVSESTGAVRVFSMKQRQRIATLTVSGPTCVLVREGMAVVGTAAGSVAIFSTSTPGAAPRTLALGAERIRFLSAAQGSAFAGEVVATVARASNTAFYLIDVRSGRHGEMPSPNPFIGTWLGTVSSDGQLLAAQLYNKDYIGQFSSAGFFPRGTWETGLRRQEDLYETPLGLLRPVPGAGAWTGRNAIYANPPQKPLRTFGGDPLSAPSPTARALTIPHETGGCVLTWGQKSLSMSWVADGFRQTVQLEAETPPLDDVSPVVTVSGKEWCFGQHMFLAGPQGHPTLFWLSATANESVCFLGLPAATPPVRQPGEPVPLLAGNPRVTRGLGDTLLVLDGSRLLRFDRTGQQVGTALTLPVAYAAIVEATPGLVAAHSRGLDLLALDGKRQRSIPLPASAVHEVALCAGAGGCYVSFQGESQSLPPILAENQVAYVDLKTGRSTTLARVYGRHLALSPDGKILATSFGDTVRAQDRVVLDLINWTIRPDFERVDVGLSCLVNGPVAVCLDVNPAPPSDTQGLLLTPDGAQLFYRGDAAGRRVSGTLKILDVTTFKIPRVSLAATAYPSVKQPRCAAYSPVSPLSAFATEQGVQFLDWRTGLPIAGVSIATKLPGAPASVEGLFLLAAHDRAIVQYATANDGGEEQHWLLPVQIGGAPPPLPAQSKATSPVPQEALMRLAHAGDAVPRDLAEGRPRQKGRPEEAVLRIDTWAGQGSGVVIHPDGWILTCAHVIPPFGDPLIYLKTGGDTPGGGAMPANVVLVDEARDLALLRVFPAAKLPWLTLASSAAPAAPGTPVAAWGFPGGDQTKGAEPTLVVGRGIVSVGDRRVGDEGFLQTNVKVNPGCSGGPMIGEDGRIVGVTVLKRLWGDTAYAVPVDAIRAFLVKAGGPVGR